jgi:hypothetical protein
MILRIKQKCNESCYYAQKSFEPSETKIICPYTFALRLQVKHRQLLAENNRMKEEIKRLKAQPPFITQYQFPLMNFADTGFDNSEGLAGEFPMAA